MVRTGRLLLLLIALVALISACSRKEGKPAPGRSSSGPSASAANFELRARLQARRKPDYVAADDEGVRVWKAVRRFYQLDGYQLAWIWNGRPRRDVDDLLETIAEADREGMDPSSYRLSSITFLRTVNFRNPFKRHTLETSQAADADLQLTYTFMKYATHLVEGRVEPGELDPHWFARGRRVDLANYLQKALDEDQVDEALQALRPHHPQYEALREALARFREIASRGGWPRMPENLAVRKRQRDRSVLLLRARLAASGDLAEAPTRRRAEAVVPPGDPSLVFDTEVEEALKRFENRHGLKPDGRLDRETIAAMNVPVEERIDQIVLSMERWRWLPEKLGDRHMIVNVPGFRLDAFEDDQPVLSMRVIVGKQDNPTPIFTDEMTTIVFSPYWNIPSSIAMNETLPAVLRDPAYLRRNNLEVLKGSEVVDPEAIDWSAAAEDFPYRFRQRPGTRNSLGQIKFVFPNQFNVYLHDTPADSLFEKLERSFSHGCVRVEKPVELAQWLLQGQPEWNQERIVAAMNSGQEQHVALKQPAPVYLLYQTAWVGSDGTTQFFDDLYGHDARQARLLRDAAPDRPARARTD